MIPHLNASMKTNQAKLLQASRDNDTQSVLNLLALGIEPNYRDHIFPIHAAAICGNPVTLEALLKSGANPNARSMMGHTALQYAMTRNHPIETVLQLVTLLLQYGAVADTHGDFAHHSKFAYALKSQELMDLLGFSMKECAERERQEREELELIRKERRELLRARRQNAPVNNDESGES